MENKKVKKRFNFKKFLVFLLFIYLIAYSIYYLFTSPIKNIIITGNNLVSDREIIELAGIKNYPSIFTLKKSKLIKKIKKNDYIKDVKIKRNYKAQLFIEITENKIVLYNSSNKKLMLSNGNYIDLINYTGIPTLINYAPNEELNSFVKEMGKLDNSIISLINEIEYAPLRNEENKIIDGERFKLKMNDGNTVFINSDKCNVLSHYKEIYSSLNDKKGILNLDSGNYDNFVFKIYGDNDEL